MEECKNNAVYGPNLHYSPIAFHKSDNNAVFWNPQTPFEYALCWLVMTSSYYTYIYITLVEQQWHTAPLCFPWGASNHRFTKQEIDLPVPRREQRSPEQRGRPTLRGRAVQCGHANANGFPFFLGPQLWPLLLTSCFHCNAPTRWAEK